MTWKISCCFPSHLTSKLFPFFNLYSLHNNTDKCGSEFVLSTLFSLSITFLWPDRTQSIDSSCLLLFVYRKINPKAMICNIYQAQILVNCWSGCHAKLKLMSSLKEKKTSLWENNENENTPWCSRWPAFIIECILDISVPGWRPGPCAPTWRIWGPVTPFFTSSLLAHIRSVCLQLVRGRASMELLQGVHSHCNCIKRPDHSSLAP
jgi:hypothetical protein